MFFPASSRRSLCWSATLLSCLMFFVAAPDTFAQAVSGGQMHGRVTDPSGAGIVGATITAIQTDSGLKRSTASGSDGGFTLTNLPVGPYRVETSAPGFGTFGQSGLILRVGDDLLVNASLQLGNLSQQVEVAGTPTDVQTENTSMSEVIDQHRMVNLPLNGRQATQLILLSGAAATAPAGDLATTKNYPSSVTISVAGGQANGTNYLLDGGDNNDAFSNVNLPFPFPDSLQEFSVETTGLAARYGLHPGAVVNVVTKSGSNQFHGTLFEFIRNGDLNARNFFAATQDTLRRNQFGGTVGGPVLRNRLFFFFGYQGTQTRTTPPNTISFVPTAAMRNGDFSAFESASCKSSGIAGSLRNPNGGTFPGNSIPTSLLNPQALAVLQYIPTASDPCGRLTYGIPNPSSEHQYIGRVDWNQSTRHSFFGRYFLSDYNNPPFFNANLLNTTRAGLLDRSQTLTLGDTYSFSPNLLNGFRATGTRLAISRGTASDVINPKTVGIPVSVPIPNYLGLTVTNDFGVGGTIPSFWNNNSWQTADDVDWIRGRHHLSFGANWIHNQLNTVGAINMNGVFTFNGQFTGDSLADFMLGRLSDFNQGNPTGGNFRQNYVGLYTQDDLRLNSHLNIRLGVRWEPFLPEHDIFNRGANFSRAAFDSGLHSSQYINAPPGLLFYGDTGVPKGYVQRRLNLFEPRVGFAWDPSGKGRQSIRGSYTIGYDTPEVFYQARFETNAPFGSTVDIPSPVGGLSNPFLGYPGGNPFPLPFPPPKTQSFSPAGVYVVLPNDLRPTYMQQWNLSFQQQIGHSWLATATYIGNKTTHIWAGTELNPAVYIPGICGTATCSSTGNTNQRRVLYRANPSAGAGYASLAQTDDGANSNFNGIVLSLQHRFTSNYTVLSNYTLSHCLGSSNFAGDITAATYQNPNNRNADYGNCSFDVRQNFNTSMVVSIPRLQNAWASTLLAGWQLAPILTARTGFPYTPVTGTDASLTGVGLDRPNVLSNPYVKNEATRQWANARAYAPNAPGTYGNAGSYSLVGPNFVSVDLALSRIFTLREIHHFEVRSEFFNILNHTNFANPSGTLSSQNFGVLLAANDPRILQFALKYSF